MTTGRSVAVRDGGGTIDVQGNDVTIGGPMSQAGTGTLHKDGAGTLTLANVRAAGLAVDAGRVNVTANGTDAGTGNLGSLALAAGTTLDLNDNKLVLNYTGTSPAEDVRQQLKLGRDGGWAGPGIVSTTVKNAAGGLKGMANLEASDVLGLTGTETSTWAGQTVDADSLLLAIAFNGDVTLDGNVNRDDYALVDRARAKGTTGWRGADFNYDGVTDSADLQLMDLSFIALHPGGLSPDLIANRQAEFGDGYVAGLLASVPEPASVGMLLVAGGALAGTGRRSRKR
jgi:hypothetical protein